MADEHQGMGLDEFLGHKSTDYGGKGSFLEKWRDAKKDSHIDVWLHTRAKIASLWQHGQPRVVEFSDKETKQKKQMVFFGQWTCWEDEEVLKKQRHRDEETGRRIKPPVICPECLFQEWLREQVEAGEVDWTKVIFRYEAKDSDEPVIIHAGGMTGLFGKKTLSDKEQEQLRKARINRKEAWKENQIAKLSYVFSVVDNEHPNKGCCIATEPNLLGDKVKEVIQKAILEAEDEGNPLLHPYCIRWMHRPDAQEFGKKYDAGRLGKVKLTDEIRKLIVDSDPPNLGRTLARRNPFQLRALWEQACLLKGVPWDLIFGRACKAWEDKEGKEGSEAEGTDFDPGKIESSPRQREAKRLEEELCEECGELIPAGAAKCPGCGAKSKASAALDNAIGDELPY